MRHIKKFQIMDNEAIVVRHFPIEDNRSFEAQEWGVKIGINETSLQYTTVIGPLTLTDLLRLRRVVNRAIKVVQNPKKHNKERHW